jgi:hypothetical protein
LSAFEAPDGQCAFASRCAFALDACRETAPETEELDGGLSRCLRAGELRGRLAPDRDSRERESTESEAADA